MFFLLSVACYLSVTALYICRVWKQHMMFGCDSAVMCDRRTGDSLHSTLTSLEPGMEGKHSDSTLITELVQKEL